MIMIEFPTNAEQRSAKSRCSCRIQNNYRSYIQYNCLWCIQDNYLCYAHYKNQCHIQYNLCYIQYNNLCFLSIVTSRAKLCMPILCQIYQYNIHYLHPVPCGLTLPHLQCHSRPGHADVSSRMPLQLPRI